MRMMINKIPSKVNHALKMAIPMISIEIRLKIIYVDTIRSIFFISIPLWKKLPLKK